jgi:peptide/nickel transport system substrate-binding protein
MGLGTFDVDRASQILEDAGYVDADSDGWRDMPDGTPIEFTIQIVNGWTDG